MILSRATLRPGVGAAHLTRYARRGAHPAAIGHALMWDLFGSAPKEENGDDQRQDFIWRDEGDGTYVLFSKEQPITDHPLLTVESKAFPALRGGDHLRFILRGNAVRHGPVKTQGQRERGKRFGIIQMALAKREPDRETHEVATEAVSQWIERQADAAGFEVDGRSVSLTGWQVVSVPRGRHSRPMMFEQFEVNGVLKVGEDPERVRAALLRGFGRSRGFGCGLMKVGRR